jgi:hypothetical protein
MKLSMCFDVIWQSIICATNLLLFKKIILSKIKYEKTLELFVVMPNLLETNLKKSHAKIQSRLNAIMNLVQLSLIWKHTTNNET